MPKRSIRMVCLLAAAASTCPDARSEEDVQRAARDILLAYKNRTPIGVWPYALAPDEAAATRRIVVERLARDLGPVVGYKAALTNRVAQERMGIRSPVLGYLLRDMLLRPGSKVPLDFAAAGAVEADLVVRVGDDAIARASTRSQALECLDAVFPFLELPDLLFASSVRRTPAMIVAANAGARMGVLGEAIPLDADVGRRLSDFSAQLLDPADKAIARGNGADLMGHPLDVVLWIKEELRNSGVELKRGDLLSLGSLTPPTPISTRGAYRVRYDGLVGTKAVELRVVIE